VAFLFEATKGKEAGSCVKNAGPALRALLLFVADFREGEKGKRKWLQGFSEGLTLVSIFEGAIAHYASVSLNGA